MAKKYLNLDAEREANEIGFKFANSSDVMADMSRAYNVDFSDVKIHTDDSADSMVKAAGTDALTQGKDIFFGKGIYDDSNPESKGLLAHELAHTMQQGVVGDGAVAGVHEEAPMEEAQGGLLSWFKGLFKPKTKYLGGEKSTDEASKKYMAAMRAKEMELLMGDAVKSADEAWDSNADKDARSRESAAMQGFGLRGVTNRIARVDGELRAPIFDGFMGQGLEHINQLEAGGMNFATMKDRLSSDAKRFDLGPGLAAKKYTSETASSAGAMMSLLEDRLTTDEGLDYLKGFVKGASPSKVFSEGGSDVMDFALQSIFNYETLNMGHSIAPADASKGMTAEEEGKSKYLYNVGALITAMPKFTGKDEAAEQAPPEIKTLLKQYVDLREKLRAAVGAKAS